MSVCKVATIAVIGLAVALAACAGSPDGTGPKKGRNGRLLGAGTGALLGSAVAGGGSGNRLAGAAIGAGLGTLIGNRIGAALDDEDRQRAYAAQMDALDHASSGAPVSWKNPDSGRYGTVVPGPTYVGERPQLPLFHPHHLYRWPPADRPRHRLPQCRRQLDFARLSGEPKDPQKRMFRPPSPQFLDLAQYRRDAALYGSGRNRGYARAGHQVK